MLLRASACVGWLAQAQKPRGEKKLTAPRKRQPDAQPAARTNRGPASRRRGRQRRGNSGMDAHGPWPPGYTLVAKLSPQRTGQSDPRLPALRGRIRSALLRLRSAACLTAMPLTCSIVLCYAQSYPFSRLIPQSRSRRFCRLHLRRASPADFPSALIDRSSLHRAPRPLARQPWVFTRQRRS
jgi:hypothetical protein